MTPYAVTYDPTSHVLRISLSGVLNHSDVDACRDALEASTAHLPNDTSFRTLVNLFDYEVAGQDLAVHKRMREVVPNFLAAHGFATGFWAFYEVEPPAPSRPGRCTQVAHVHHDCMKMDRYNEIVAISSERFFCDVGQAHAWLEDRSIT